MITVSMARSVPHNFVFDDTDDAEVRARALTEYWIGRAREITGASARRLSVPEVHFDLRGRAAGQTVFARRTRRCHIRLNRRLLASHPTQMLEQTVPHEVAHVVIYRLHSHRVKPHGPEWKALMHAFGVDASPCHTLPAEPSRQLKRYRYVCRCDEPVWLTSIRHKRARAGTDYICRSCGARLEYVDT